MNPMQRFPVTHTIFYFLWQWEFDWSQNAVVQGMKCRRSAQAKVRRQCREKVHRQSAGIRKESQVEDVQTMRNEMEKQQGETKCRKCRDKGVETKCRDKVQRRNAETQTVKHANGVRRRSQGISVARSTETKQRQSTDEDIPCDANYLFPSSIDPKCCQLAYCWPTLAFWIPNWSQPYQEVWQKRHLLIFFSSHSFSTFFSFKNFRHHCFFHWIQKLVPANCSCGLKNRVSNV